MNTRLILSIILLVALAACSSKKAVVTAPQPATAGELVARMTAAPSPADVTARCSYDLTMGGKHIQMGGSFKMQRDRIIQLSITVPLIGIEAVRVEFTPDQITIIDRIHKRYVRDTYDSVAFARDNNLDFSVAQALFGGELFTLGGDYTLTASGDNAVLTTRNDVLTVNFVTSLATAELRQTNVTGTRDMSKSLNVHYTDYQGTVPTAFTIATGGLADNLSIGFALSGVKTDTGASLAPTDIDARYRRMDPATAFSSLLSF